MYVCVCVRITSKKFLDHYVGRGMRERQGARLVHMWVTVQEILKVAVHAILFFLRFYHLFYNLV